MEKIESSVLSDIRHTTYDILSPRILIVNPFGIGDVLFTTPIIGAIRKQYPNAYIGYICNIRTAPFILSDPNVNKCFIFEKDEYRHLWKISKYRCLLKLYRLLREARDEKFDTVFDLSLAREFGLFLKLAGIKKRIGYNYKKRGIFLTNKIDLDGYHDKHMAEYYISLMALAGIESPEGLCMHIYIPEKSRRNARDLLLIKGIADDEGFVCMAPGGGLSWGGTSFRKQWPKENFLEIAKVLCGELNLKVVLIGSGEDKQMCGYIKEKEARCIDLCGETDLLTSAGIIDKARMLIANDGGPLHIAAALGTDTVSIFGPVDDKVYGPYPVSEKHIVIRNDSLSCRPCYRNFKIPECGHRDCLNKISAQTVVEAVKRSIL
ncbi:MAG: lipopolysaccharide heptosyltransferase II [Candidatus Omnitrophota bacterium]